ncbi:GbsR/MarR family transcriptional regulator [Actinocrispum wychmicini]|uniref:GbsR/MarR family transcriptional regulator n=1 Tax=Actinocrispum wychmicini TaxID=1213861 RepID=UPI001FB7319D|nr:MarR family transcriptional regulator [Actinocrispum wychmicini]
MTRFIERFAGHLADAGMQRMAARVFITLLSEDTGRLTAAELADALQVSPAAISGAVRYLTQVNMVVREREPGSRRDYYTLNSEDLWYDMITQREQLVQRWDSVLREGVAALGETTPAGLRIRETAAFMDFLHEEMPVFMKKWHERRARLLQEWDMSD